MKQSQSATNNLQPGNSLSRVHRSNLLQRLTKLILKHHVNVSGIDYQTWVATIETRTPDLLSCGIGVFEDGIREILTQLGTSHTVFYSGRDALLMPQHSINATVRALPVNGVERWMFLDIFEGGPADAAGIRAGELFLALNGQSCEPPTMPKFDLGRVHKLRVSDIHGEREREVQLSCPKGKAQNKGRRL